MSNFIDYTKLANLLETKEYLAVLKILEENTSQNYQSIHLLIVEIYCQIEINQMHTVELLTKKLKKHTPHHYMIPLLENYILQKINNLQIDNPLTSFVHAFINYHKIETMENKLLENVLKKRNEKPM